ncbi:hypothetical protein T12_1647 [Trichinella patagoniensis]|uniref:Uncharacterized protein n=1 Tax=Trichinella patagoniensis TaxID=990121 RepID=A0A0V0ZYM2_9BILA|nr:hypothetical protein T12_1647 [Trichinella patagoniensis]
MKQDENRKKNSLDSMKLSIPMKTGGEKNFCFIIKRVSGQNQIWSSENGTGRPGVQAPVEEHLIKKWQLFKRGPNMGMVKAAACMPRAVCIYQFSYGFGRGHLPFSFPYLILKRTKKWSALTLGCLSSKRHRAADDRDSSSKS